MSCLIFVFLGYNFRAFSLWHVRGHFTGRSTAHSQFRVNLCRRAILQDGCYVHDEKSDQMSYRSHLTVNTSPHRVGRRTRWIRLIDRFAGFLLHCFPYFPHQYLWPRLPSNPCQVLSIPAYLLDSVTTNSLHERPTAHIQRLP
jgi:hypothetical protein